MSAAMSTKNYVFLIVITSIYLVFELAFNARLLDVVGGNASMDDVHHIEVYGRTLSGIAAALVALQLLMAAHRPVIHRVVVCLTVGAVVYFSLQALVNTLV